MGMMTSQITSLIVVYSTFYSGANQRKHQLRVTGLCVGNSPGTGEFLAKMASNAENVSIWWRHHDTIWRYIIEIDQSLPGLRHQTNTWININWQLAGSHGINLRAISNEWLQIPNTNIKMYVNVKWLKIQSHVSHGKKKLLLRSL